MLTVENFLAHYGVKGMKWGVRKDRRRSAYSKDYARTRRIQNRAKKSGVTSLSNKELKDLNTRIELEKKYRELKNQTSTIKRGESQVNKIIGLVGTATAAGALGAKGYNYLTSPQGQRLVQIGLDFIRKFGRRSPVGAALNILT